MALYALLIFLSAFLLFQVQPLIGKFILPWFGGAPAVWTTCLLFFQFVLLVGYGYAHVLARYFSRHVQSVVHCGLLGVTLLLLPITPSRAVDSATHGSPTWQILVVLAVSVGGPFLLLSATAPLLQSWFSKQYSGRSPYRLYALSNAGSLLALLTYPVLVERYLRLNTQTMLWSAAYLCFAILCGLCAVVFRRSSNKLSSADSADPADHEPAIARASEARSQSTQRRAKKKRRRPRDWRKSGPAAPDSWTSQPVTVGSLLLWLSLSACGTVNLMATTNQMCQNVAVVPFLWVLPLSLYLLTFILCFSGESWYRRLPCLIALATFVALIRLMVDLGAAVPLTLQIAVYALALFFACMLCHGELVRLKPDPRDLTVFYFCTSLGGVLGGVFVTLIAPQIFEGFWEFQLGLVASCVLVLAVLVHERAGELWRQSRRGKSISLTFVSLVACVIVAGLLSYFARVTASQYTRTERNFYGVTWVVDEDVDQPRWHRRKLLHGRTEHGFQYLEPDKRRVATAYYGPKSGVGLALRNCHASQVANRPLKIGAVGLGVGTIASYADENDTIRFYEINSEVADVARELFTYLDDADERGAELHVILGDARLELQREWEQSGSHDFDVLAVDAFSGESIPNHLLTMECFLLYWQHLKPDGILAIHITNDYLDLSPVIRTLAASSDREAIWIHQQEASIADDAPQSTWYENDWILVTRDQRFLNCDAVVQMRRPWQADQEEPVLWTDDFSSLIPLLK